MSNRYLRGAHVLGTYAEEADDLSQLSEGELVRRAVREVGEALAPPIAQVFPTEIDGVSDEDWTAWVLAMKVAEPTTVSDAGALGMFGVKPRRLEDLGLMKNVEAVNARKKKKMAWAGDWVEPLSQEAFLASPSIQYRVLVASTKLYAHALADGSIPWVDDGVTTLSGALALLNRCGPQVLSNWSDVESRHEATIKIYEATNELF